MNLKIKLITLVHDQDKYITTQEFDKITAKTLPARLAQASLVRKNHISNFVKKANLNKNELNELSEKVKAISTKRLTSFSSGIFQNYLVFIPANKCIKYFSGNTWIDLWKYNGLSEENIENITKSNCNFPPTFVNHHILPDINFNGHCLINNIYISLKKW